MTSHYWKQCIGIGVVGIAATMSILAWQVSAEPPASSTSPESLGNESKISGVIAEFVENDHGDVDGVRLENGELIHFPPHIGAVVTEAVQVGDEITIRGHEATLPRGERIFEAENIASQDVSIDVVPPRGQSPRSPEEESRMHAAGTVSELSVNPHDDVDGFTLGDGTVVKFPPHQSAALAALVTVGTKVDVRGRRHETPRGDVHLHADRITATDSGKSLERSKPHDRPLPPPHGGPHGHAGPEVGRVQQEILHELREIRRLLQAEPAR
ncbi:OB-fold nucleic acid binding domain-containing protein [Lacipirellula sp.]|uniref:OB-fold nucleic acid binding domain-containing protein n=1 Tax=Lacipirellula sp. TaxID=2691419 RepID=UPI003D14A6AC